MNAQYPPAPLLCFFVNSFKYDSVQCHIVQRGKLTRMKLNAGSFVNKLQCYTKDDTENEMK